MRDSPQAQVLEVRNFSGGKTDSYISGDPSQFQDAINLVISDSGKLQTRDGVRLFDELNPQIPGGAARISTLVDSEGQLFQQAGQNLHFIEGGVFKTLTSASAGPVFGLGNTASVASFAKWNKHLFAANDMFSPIQRIYRDGAAGNAWSVHNLGLPKLATTPTVTRGAAGTKNFIVGFCYKISYQIGAVTFEERGPVTRVEVENAADPVTNPITVTGIPSLSNAGGNNFALFLVQIEIYRSQDAGDVLWLEKTLPASVPSTTLNMSDDALEANMSIYTDGGVLDFDPPPPSKFIIEANGIIWYLHVKENGVVYPNRFRQALPGSPFAAPASLAEDVDSEIVGGAAVNIYPIIFCKSGKKYRVEGQYDLTGNGTVVKREILGEETGELLAHNSIVKVNGGICFAAKNGFFFTDGFTAKKLSGDFDTTFKKISQLSTHWKRISATYDPVNNRVLWAVTTDSTSTDNDLIFVAHLNFKSIKGGSAFTTWNGGDVPENFRPSALHYFDGLFLRADYRGYLFKEDALNYTDLKINALTSPATWNPLAIVYEYLSCAYDFGTTTVRKWVPQMVINADNKANLSLAVASCNDTSGTFSELKELKFNSSLIWGDPTIQWGDPRIRWNFLSIIDGVRRFPAKGIRCSYKQIRFSSAFTTIDDSTSIGTASYDATTKILELDNPDFQWMEDAVDYYLVFDAMPDELFVIKARNGTQLTIKDDANFMTSGTELGWKIMGYRRGDALLLHSYSIKYVLLTSTQADYSKGGNE